MNRNGVLRILPAGSHRAGRDPARYGSPRRCVKRRPPFRLDPAPLARPGVPRGGRPVGAAGDTRSPWIPEQMTASPHGSWNSAKARRGIRIATHPVDTSKRDTPDGNGHADEIALSLVARAGPFRRTPRLAGHRAGEGQGGGE